MFTVNSLNVALSIKKQRENKFLNTKINVVVKLPVI